MSHPRHRHLSRRERQIVDILYRLEEASAADVRGAMTDAPSDSAVRALLALLVEKGHVRHRQEGRKYLYAPVVSATKARKSELRHVVETFFAGSAEEAVASLLDQEAARLGDEELDRLARLIEDARKKRRRS
ncbi:MAG: BlaI/MecI/CopY family transcriptional regulator [Planctomycetota bacterium]